MVRNPLTWIAFGLVFVVYAAAGIARAAWWLKGGQPVVEENGWVVLKHDAWSRSIAVLVAFAGLMIVIDLYSDEPYDVGLVVFFFALTLTMLFIVLPDMFLYKIKFNADEFIVRTAWGKPRRIPWDSVTHATYAGFRSAYRVYAKCDGAFLVYENLTGSDEFMCRVRAEREKKQRRARANRAFEPTR